MEGCRDNIREHPECVVGGSNTQFGQMTGEMFGGRYNLKYEAALVERENTATRIAEREGISKNITKLHK